MYREALLAKSAASNYITLIQGFSRVLPYLWKEAIAQGQRIDFVNHHPICRLYLQSLCRLSGTALQSQEGELDACQYCVQRSQN